MNEIRVGNVYSVNYAEGTVRVIYEDKSDKGTTELPVFCAMGEYQMPKVGDQVLVLHLSNDSSFGVVMGKFWNAIMKPPQPGPGVYRKDFAENGSAYLQVLSDGALTIRGGEVSLQGAAGSITVSELIAMKRRLDTIGEGG